MKVLAVLSLALLTGCATHKELTREEFIATTTRQYDGVTVEQVAKAAEKVFRLADGNDFQIQHTEDGLTASRRWLVYLLISATAGVDYWTVTAKPSGDGVLAKVSAATQYGNMVPLGQGVTTMPGHSAGVRGTSLYDTFWRRMDYVLGKSDKWSTCDDAAKKRSTGETWGLDEALCNSFNMKDLLPEELRRDDPKPSAALPY